ncbi:DUF4097 family beta strand repeat-containing protein [Actinoplanes flavus]|uniref:DUF4097 family beta strand repeat protein n=1 Tax=Actinoplanes flavus TaxID=2820290 RepID=A0ABS3UI14_9ACTN|nr:DUF4097 family beta strand repeat-containing protein [Actinoplanes flavus]MBO3737373.1 DUF4097 family beta strand repeat protein [Actinoplanes flavus]
MPKFGTPGPITLDLDLGGADVQITATDRTDTLIEVRPRNASDESDTKAAEQVRIDHTDGTLRITGPKYRPLEFSRRSKAVDVTVELPSGSAVAAEVQVGNYRSAGRLAGSRFKTSAGHVSVEHADGLRVATAAGHVTVGRVTGDADISTGSGRVRVGEVGGAATVKNSNGDTTIDTAGGEVRVRAANGAITVGRAGAGVDAKTSNGEIRLGEVVRGSVTIGTSLGDLDIGIAEGTAAWVSVDTAFGRVSNQLANTTGPDSGDETVEIRGRTSYGDITIHRA